MDKLKNIVENKEIAYKHSLLVKLISFTYFLSNIVKTNKRKYALKQLYGISNLNFSTYFNNKYCKITKVKTISIVKKIFSL